MCVCVCEDGRVDDKIKQVELLDMPFMCQILCGVCCGMMRIGCVSVQAVGVDSLAVKAIHHYDSYCIKCG